MRTCPWRHSCFFGRLSVLMQSLFHSSSSRKTHPLRLKIVYPIPYIVLSSFSLPQTAILHHSARHSNQFQTHPIGRYIYRFRNSSFPDILYVNQPCSIGPFSRSTRNILTENSRSARRHGITLPGPDVRVQYDH